MSPVSNSLPAPPQPVAGEQGRRLGLFILAAKDAAFRIAAAGSAGEARRCWAAAVEAVWWIAAVDDALRAIYGLKVKPWQDLRHAYPAGRVMGGLMWVRHRHTHDAADTGQGHTRPFFPPPGSDYVVYISPGYSWRQSADIAMSHDLSPSLRPLFDEHVAGFSLHGTVEMVLEWLEASLSALGVDLKHISAEGDSRDLT